MKFGGIICAVNVTLSQQLGQLLLFPHFDRKTFVNLMTKL